jgi:DivIVA domain-containing protein
MAEPLSPNAIAQKTFGQRLRGYHPDEVGAFLEEVAQLVRELQDRSEALHTRLLELGNRDLSAEFDRISQDVGRILQDARQTAEGMRMRAASDAEALLDEAQKVSTELRSDSWMAADKLLQDSAKEAAAILQAAERDSLVITSEAEREAHHRQNAVRRESEETVRAAKLEAERVLMDARSRSDELILAAGRKVAAAEERADALETRRTEMLEELENARQTISNLEGEIEKRREALAGPSPEEVESSTVKLLTSSNREPVESEDNGVWAEGHEVVKIVRPPKRIVDPPLEPVDADAMAAEVARLRTPVTEPAEPVVEPEPAQEPTTETPHEPPVMQPEELAPAATAAQLPEPTEMPRIEETAPSVAPIPPVNEIDDLFARLRHVEAETPPGVPAAPFDGDAPIEEPSADPLPPPPVRPPVGVTDPFDLRDRLLLPVTNRILRVVKRELTEAQNIALEELRLEDGNWEPDASTLSGRLVEAVGELLADSYSSGWAAAAELTESDLVPGGVGPGDPAESGGPVR